MDGGVECNRGDRFLYLVSLWTSTLDATGCAELLALDCVTTTGNLDTRFIQFLQQTSSFVTSGFLDFLRMPHLREANIIQIPSVGCSWKKPAVGLIVFML